MNVAAVLMEILSAAGVRHLFGNPGTTELPFLDALPDSGLEYVLGLQEATAVAAADGYAQASGQVGVVNVHVAPGLANSLSILHNAARSKTPLLVTAGQQDTRFLMDEPILAGDLVRMAEQFTKWSYEVRLVHQKPRVLLPGRHQQRCLGPRRVVKDRQAVRQTGCHMDVHDADSPGCLGEAVSRRHRRRLLQSEHVLEAGVG